MFDLLVKSTLPHLTDMLQKQIIRDLKNTAKNAIAKQLATTCGHAVVKGIDGVIGVAVEHLDKTDVQKLLDGYLNQVEDQLSDLFLAIDAYIPLQLHVELEKAAHGDNSPEANQARALRQAGIDELKQECKDFLNVILGDLPAD